MDSGQGIRDQIMRALLEHEESGAPAYVDARGLAARLGIPVGEIEEWLRVCAGRRWVTLLPTAAGDALVVEMLTRAGRHHAKDLA